MQYISNIIDKVISNVSAKLPQFLIVLGAYSTVLDIFSAVF
ncbi:hypothetical protein [Thermoanaerobacterium sp. RBIITD]|nr:hypothetical protein [Thermoanaerobacterium sp. RBIITD]